MRFNQFHDSHWIKTSLKDVAKKINAKNKNKFCKNVISNSAQHGLIRQIDYFDKEIAQNESIENYTIINKGDFVYNPRKSIEAPYGPVNIYNYDEPGIVSPLYLCFSIQNINKNFLHYYFKSKAWHRFIYLYGDSGARHDRVSIKDEVFFSQQLSIPTSSDEIEKITDLLFQVEQRIGTQSKIIEDLETLKNGIWDDVYKKESLNWNKVKLKNILTERKTYCVKDSTYPHATLSKEGISLKTDRYNRDFLVKDDEKNYKVTHLNDICYNPANLKFGVICRNKLGSAIFSPIYITYEVNSNFNAAFIEYILTNSSFINYIRKYEQGTVYERMAVNSEDFLKGIIKLPPLDIQTKIINLMHSFELKIQKEKDMLELYKKQKAYLLQNMFI